MIAQLRSYLGGQWIIIGFTQIGNFNRCRIHEATCAPGGNDRGFIAFTIIDQGAFMFYAVNGIDNIVKGFIRCSGDIFFQVVFGQQVINDMALAMRVYLPDPVLHG